MPRRNNLVTTPFAMSPDPKLNMFLIFLEPSEKEMLFQGHSLFSTFLTEVCFSYSPQHFTDGTVFVFNFCSILVDLIYVFIINWTYRARSIVEGIVGNNVPGIFPPLKICQIHLPVLFWSPESLSSRDIKFHLVK